MASDAQSSPYWNILTFFLTAIVSILGTLYVVKRGAPSVPGVPTAPNALVSMLTDTIGYLPHIILLFGVIADAITQDGVYSIASLIGLASIPLNYLMSFFWTAVGDIITGLRELIESSSSSGSFPSVSQGVAVRQAKQRTAESKLPVPPMMGGGKPGDFSGNYDGCEVQGFSALKSKYAPQTLVVTATVFSYYIFDLISNRGWTSASSAFALFGALFLTQVAVIGDCDVGEIGRFTKAAAAAVEGVFFGGSAYAVVQAFYPKWLPSSAIPLFPRKSAGDLKPGPNGTMVDSDGNPYVCINGQCTPDLSSKEARKNFAEMAAENLGTGVPATPADCPASSGSA